MDKETFKKFEKAAKFDLPEIERDKILAAVNLLSERFEKLSEINTEGFPPLVSVSENLSNVLRDDKAVKFCPRDELLKQACESEDGCFVVPKAVE